MLFLAGGAHSVIDYVTGARRLSDRSITAFKTNLERRRSWAERSGAAYVHLLTPDKQSFLPELWPLKDKPLIRLGEEILASLSGDDHDIVYPIELLGRSGERNVWQVDTHYSDRGALNVATALVEKLTGEPQQTMHERLLARINTPVTMSGDLGSKLNPPRQSTEPSYTPEFEGRHLHNNLVDGNDGIIDIHLNASAPYAKRLAVMGDSFGRMECRFLRYWFREIVFLRTRFFHPELLELFRPHYVVSQNVERYLDNIAFDGMRSHFLLMPHEKDRSYDPPKDFVAVLTDLLAVGEPRYDAFLRREFGARD
ncbi:MAG: hypothetical protein KIT43_05540 [Bauldia sp.]|nr:hypothetical protein [Bauldia sp.]MCW5717086.1 hypothetical protein [Bauldia sp.]